jgi:biopolymer transport protein ExbD
MPKIKMPKSSPSIDMTPMVDLAFLLVTFFMLTASFRTTEPVIVDTPSSTSEKLLAENILLITVDKDGRAFFNINGAETRANLLEKMAAQYKVTFTPEQKKTFSLMTSFGVPIEQLPKYIDMTDPERTKIKSPGVPLDSLNNQLGDWINFGRIEAAKIAKREKDKAESEGKTFDYDALRFAIKADGKAPYISVKQVIKVFTDKEIYRFNLITSLEDANQ